MDHTFTSATLLLMLVTDPLGNIPIFSAALKDVARERKPMVIARECGFAFALLLLFLFFGEQVMQALRLSNLSLQIGGGIILFLIALRMIFPSAEGTFGAAGEGEPFLVPLAVPALAGPSAMATVMLLSAQAPNRMPEWIGAVSIAMGVSVVVLLAAERLERALGTRFIIAFERLMGLVLTAIAVEMVLNGVRSFLGAGT